MVHHIFKLQWIYLDITPYEVKENLYYAIKVLKPSSGFENKQKLHAFMHIHEWKEMYLDHHRNCVQTVYENCISHWLRELDRICLPAYGCHWIGGVRKLSLQKCFWASNTKGSSKCHGLCNSFLRLGKQQLHAQCQVHQSGSQIKGETQCSCSCFLKLNSLYLKYLPSHPPGYITIRCNIN